MKSAENLSIQDYIRESKNIASLHHQIVECDQVFAVIVVVVDVDVCVVIVVDDQIYVAVISIDAVVDNVNVVDNFNVVAVDVLCLKVCCCRKLKKFYFGFKYQKDIQVSKPRFQRSIFIFLQILERMETILLSFQSDLGSISHEILTLQQESVQMNVKLKNRQAVRGELSQFVDDMVVPEEMIV